MIFYRIGAAILMALCGAMIWTPAHAADVYQYQPYSGVPVGGFSSAAAACSAAGPAWISSLNTAVPAATRTLTAATYSGTTCTVTYHGVQVSNGAGFNDFFTVPVSVVTVTKCQWTSGDSLGKSLTVGTVETPKGATSMCYYGCQWAITVQPDFWWKATDTSPYVGHSNAAFLVGTGMQCNGSEGGSLGGGPASNDPPVTPAPLPTLPCKSGYAPGTATFNGVTTTTCQPAIGGTENKKTEVKNEPTPEGPKVTTTNETTTCTGAGSCTTTTTTSTSVNGGAATEATTSKTEGKEAYCAANKGKKECGTGSGSWQGDCPTGFKGEGDPVLVAMSTEVHKQNCLMNKETAESAKYDTAKTKTGDQTSDLPGNNTVNMGSASFDTSDSIGGKQCIGNVTGTLYGVTITLPFGTYVCPHAQNLRMILLALSFIIGYVIIARRS